MTHMPTPVCAAIIAIIAICSISSRASAVTVSVGQQEGDVIGSDDKALQSAVDFVFNKGGGTVFVKSGTYLMHNALYLRSGVSVVGLGAAPVLTKADAVSSPLAEDAGYALDEIVVEDASEFAPGMGITLSDDTHRHGWYVNVRTIEKIEGDTLFLDEELDIDYLVSRGGKVESIHPVIFGKQVRRARVENIVADGNRNRNPRMDGCRGGAIYLWKSDNCTVDNCRARNFNGDGISYQVSPNTTVTRCRAYRNSALGIHPGSGSHSTEVTGCRIYDNGGIGLFLCWRVKNSRFADNVIENNGLDGISIGHKDTDNILVGNQIEGNGRHGVHFRAESEANGGHRNVLQDNVIRDNGQKQKGDGIHLDAVTYDVEIRGNTIEDTGRDGRTTQQNGVYLAQGVDGVKTRGNTIQGHPGSKILDESGSPGNSLQL